MATTTEKGFKIPGYADKADVPGMVKDNVETAEQHLKAISKSMSDISSNINSLDSTLQIMMLNNTSKPFQNQCQTYHPILIH